MSTTPKPPAAPAPAAPARSRGWSGSSRKALTNNAFLGGKWWAEGDEFHVIYQRTFDTKFGDAYEFILVKPQLLTVSIDDFGVCTKPVDGDGLDKRDITRFAMPHLAGFEMAVQDCMTAGFPGFVFGDAVIIKCVEIQPAQEADRSPMPMFEISVDKR